MSANDAATTTNPDGSITVNRTGWYSLEQRPGGTYTLTPDGPELVTPLPKGTRISALAATAAETDPAKIAAFKRRFPTARTYDTHPESATEQRLWGVLDWILGHRWKRGN